MDSEEKNIPAQPETSPVAEAKKPRASRRTTNRKTSDDAVPTPEAEGARVEESSPATKVRKTSVRKPRASKSTSPSEEAASVPEPVSSPAAAEGEKPTAPTRVRRVSIKPREMPEPEASSSSPSSEPSAPVVVSAPTAREGAVSPSPEGTVAPPPSPVRVEPSRSEEHPVHVREVRDRSERRDREEGRESEAASGFSAPETVGGNEGGGNGGRRKRRRRNRRGGEGTSQPQQGGGMRVDPDELARRAWKIYLGEVTEEGLALMDDRTASEASRRAFRVAELFLLEAARHRPSAGEPMADASEEEASESSAEEG